MDKLESKLKEDWDKLSVPEDKVKDAIRSGIQKAPKKKIPYKKIGATFTAIAAIFFLYILQQNNYPSYESSQPKSQDVHYEEQAETYDNSSSENQSAKKMDATIPSTVVPDRKIIQLIDIRMESKSYEDSLEKIEDRVHYLDGFIDYSYSYNNEDSDYEMATPYSSSNNRYTSLTVRIPEDSLDNFLKKISENGHIISKEENRTDVTSDYQDIETRKENLKIQETRLQTLLSEATSLTDIIEIESRLSDVGYQLESYESQLKNYDQQIDYATVQIQLEEVDTYQKSNPSIGDRIKDGFANLQTLATNFIVWFVVYGILIIGIGLIAWFVYRQIKKRKSN